jgi:hypothetical protein
VLTENCVWKSKRPSGMVLLLGDWVRISGNRKPFYACSAE